MNKSIFTVLMMVLVLCSALPIKAQNASLPITLDRFEIDDIELAENSVTRLSVQRDNDFTARIAFTPTDNLRNVQVSLFASGFEFSDVSPIASTSKVFDADANVTYVRSFKMHLTDEVQEDDYKLRLIISDRNNREVIKNYNLKFDILRHSLRIEDVVLYPADAVQAGNALLATVRLENQGEKVENDIRVEVSIPDLGVSGVDYIDEIKSGGNREKGTEEIFLRIPECAKAGRYDVLIKVWFNELHDSLTGKYKVNVIETPVCAANKAAAQKPAAPETVIVLKNDVPQNDSKTLATAQQPATPNTTVSGMTLRDALEAILLVLIAVLVIVAIIIAFRGLNQEDDGL